MKRILNQDGFSKRVNKLLEEYTSPHAFALTVGIDPGNFTKKKNGKIPWTTNDAKKICKVTSVSQKWLITGYGDMFEYGAFTTEPAPIPNIGEEIKDLDEAIRLSQKGLTNQEQMDQVLSMYSACIRRFDDDHARINEELKELSLARQTLNKEIEEVRSLKAALHDAIFMLRTSTQQESNYKPLMASDNDNNI